MLRAFFEESDAVPPPPHPFSAKPSVATQREPEILNDNVVRGYRRTESQEERFRLLEKKSYKPPLPASTPLPTEQSSRMGLLAKKHYAPINGRWTEDGEGRGVPAIANVSPAKLPSAAFSKGMYVQKFVIVFPSLVSRKNKFAWASCRLLPLWGCFLFFLVTLSEGEDVGRMTKTAESQVERIRCEMQS